MVKGAVGKFDREGFGVVGIEVDLLHAVQGLPVFVIVVRDVEAGAGGCRDQDGEEEEVVYMGLSHGMTGSDCFIQTVTPKVIFFRKRRLT